MIHITGLSCFFAIIIKGGLEHENKKLHACCTFAIHLGELEEIGKVLDGQLLP